MLNGRTIVLGVTGGISAYKAVEVCRRLTDAGAVVLPVMTEGAERFVGRATFSALASEPVRTSLFDEPDPIPHTRLGRRADLVLVCPATARLLGSYAAGISDDLLTATLLATEAPVLVCPAMHTEMWEHPAVQQNLRTLQGRGVRVVPPESGRLAGGDYGAGRLAEPATVVAAVEALFSGAGPAGGGRGLDLEGRRVLISAGGTREAIDPVRVITNRSSGRQGHALAEAALARGAKVTLVSTQDRPAPAGVDKIHVASAADMEAAIVPAAPDQDVIIMAAAVADFTIADPSPRKIKKQDGAGTVELRLVPTHDFLVDLGRDKPTGQVLVGFAAETDDLLANAAGKLARKNLDLIVANDVSAPGVGFEHETNEVTILGADGTQRPVPLASKREIADAILDEVVRRLAGRSSGSERTGG